MKCDCPSGIHDCSLHGKTRYGATGPGTPHARMEAMWEWMDGYDVELEEIVGYHPFMNVAREVALMAAFEKLLDWWQQTRDPAATPTFAYNELRSGSCLPKQKPWHAHILKENIRDEETAQRFFEKMRELGVPLPPEPQPYVHDFRRRKEHQLEEWFHCACGLGTRDPIQYRRLVNGQIAEPR